MLDPTLRAQLALAHIRALELLKQGEEGLVAAIIEHNRLSDQLLQQQDAEVEAQIAELERATRELNEKSS